MQTEPITARRSPVAYRGHRRVAHARHIDTRNPAQISRISRELGITWLQLFRIIDRVGTDLRTVRSAVLHEQGVTWH